MRDPVARGILVTRPEPGGSATAAALTEMGWVPILAPILIIQPRPAHPPPPRQIAAILLPSANALIGLDATWHHHRVLTVGAATAAHAIAAGFTTVESANGDAHALVTLTARTIRCDTGTLLLACAEGQSLDLAKGLRAAGFRVARRVVYAAKPANTLPHVAAEALRSGRLRAVLFFSAETARHFMRLVRAAGLGAHLARLEAITIGPKAGMALKDGGWSQVRVTGLPTQAGMLALLR